MMTYGDMKVDSKEEGQRVRKLIHEGSVKLIQCTAYGRGKLQIDYDSKKTKVIKKGTLRKVNMKSRYRYVWNCWHFHLTY